MYRGLMLHIDYTFFTDRYFAFAKKCPAIERRVAAMPDKDVA